MPTNGRNTYPGPAILTPNGDVILVVLGESSDWSEKDPKWSVQLFRVSPQLELQSQSKIDIPGAGGLRASIVAFEGNYLLSVVDDFYTFSSEELVDAMWQRRWCSPAPKTWIYDLQADSLSLRHVMSESGVAISRLETTPSGVLGVGYVAGCDGRRQLSAWTIAGTSMTVLYQEPKVYESSGNGILSLRDGRTLIVGTTTRTTDVRRIEERQATLSGQVDWQPRLSFSARETRDLVAVLIGRTGQLETRKIVSFGSDVSPNTSIEFGERVLIAGAVGNQASLVELHVPRVVALTH